MSGSGQYRDIGPSGRHGSYGTANIGQTDLPMARWEIQHTDMSFLAGFLQLSDLGYPRYRITLSVKLDRINHRALQLLSRPVERATLQPAMLLRQVKLYVKGEDHEPEVQFEEIRIIAGPMTAANVLAFDCVNLTLPRWKD